MTLTMRERYVRLFHGQPVDRVPFWDIMGMWPSAIARWKREGLAQDATVETIRQIVGFDGHRGFQLPVTAFIWPEFDRQVVERQADHLTVRNRWGAIEQTCVDSEVMPLTIQGAVHDRASWRAIKARLDPDTPGRLPANWAEICQQARDSQEPVYAGDLPIGFFGGPRELLGFERLVTLFYDDPALLEKILDTLCDLWIGLYTRVQRDIALDWFMVWEDMCYKKGPLISPKLFRQFLLPRYQRLTTALRDGGCPHIMVDSDGDERPLVDLWLEGGVTITFPWESQFGLDVTAVRRQWPKMGIIGGLNKHALAQGREAMDAELAKVPWLLEQGRYLPGLDHGVPTDVSWDDYRYFFDRLRTLIYRYPPIPD
jgi:uroporphyrinogen decarboxylase